MAIVVDQPQSLTESSDSKHPNNPTELSTAFRDDQLDFRRSVREIRERELTPEQQGAREALNGPYADFFRGEVEAAAERGEFHRYDLLNQPRLRDQLTAEQRHLTGSGIAVYVVEPKVEGSTHAEAVMSVIVGVAPQVELTHVPHSSPSLRGGYPETIDGLAQLMRDLVQDGFTSMARTLADITARVEAHGRPSVVNMSYGQIFQPFIDSMSLELVTNQDPEVNQAIFGSETVPTDPSVRDRAISQFIQRTLTEERGDGLTQAYEQYEATLREAQDAGIVIVISSGNSRETMLGSPSTVLGQVNLFTTSQTINVAAIDGNLTPQNPVDDILTDFSSLGLITVSAAGEGIIMRNGQERSSGTSFAAPQVAGVVALMLEENPNLSPSQIQEVLRTTATPLVNPRTGDYYSEYEVGGGALDISAAIQAARRMESEPSVQDLIDLFPGS